MPLPLAAPSEADALRRLAEAAKRVHLPATLLQFVLALLAFLTGNKTLTAQVGAALAGCAIRTWRMPLKDWHFSPNGETLEDLAPVLSPRALRRLRQQRAWLGWILRGLPGRSLRRSGKPAPAPRPKSTARAPPQPRHTPLPPRIRPLAPAPRGDDSRPHVGRK